VWAAMLSRQFADTPDFVVVTVDFVVVVVVVLLRDSRALN
jgi:hypothetical protein